MPAGWAGGLAGRTGPAGWLGGLGRRAGRSFPGDWHLAVERIVAEERSAASWIQMTDQGETYPGLCFFEIDGDGRIARITDFWPAPYEVPASRAHLVERC